MHFDDSKAGACWNVKKQLPGSSLQTKLKSGGFYAFPGGKVDNQDTLESYQKVMPEFASRVGRFYHDFTRELQP